MVLPSIIWSQDCIDGIEVELWDECYNINETTWLDLYGQGLSGEIPPEIGDLVNLYGLHLSNNNLTGEIPQEIGNLTNLSQLGLWGNNLTGNIPSEIGNLTNLTDLILGENNFTGEIPLGIGNLISLRQLDIWGSNLSGQIPSSIGNLIFLEKIWLQENNLTGEIPSEIGNLTYLLELALHRNNLIGEIPPEIGNLTNLSVLSLGGNSISGSIPSEIGYLTNLEFIYAWENQLSGEIPSEIGNLTNLIHLEIDRNNFEGDIPSEISNLTNLRHLELWQNNLSGPILSYLVYLNQLELIEIDQNNFTGTIPSEIGDLSNLYALWLSENQFSGEIPSEIGSLQNLTTLTLGDNQFSGGIPQTICNLDLNIIWDNFDITQYMFNVNQFCPPYPDCISDYIDLEEQDITNCFSCEDEDVYDLWGNCYHVDYTYSINLSNNNISGPIPTELENFVNLNYLHLRDNNLTGLVSDFICGIDSYSLVNNSLCGPFPDCIDGNSVFPQENSDDCDEYCNNDTQVNLFGYCYDIDETTEIILNNSQLTGEIPPEVGNLVNLEILYLNGNQLTGVIPSEIGSLTNLERMYLNGNQLTGVIPSEIGSLTNLERMYLNENALSGFIPETLCDLNINFGSSFRFRIYNNYLCPPYPECLSEDDVGEQDTSNCGEGSVTVDYQSDWNLVGLPLEVEDNDYLTIFPDAIENTLFAFNDAYFLDTILVNGDGYWLRFDSSGTTTINGNPISEFTISLNEDWNLVSGLHQDISIYSFNDPDSTIVPNTLFGFSDAYFLTEELIPGKGYWLRAFQDGEITLTTGALAKTTTQDYSLKANTISINGSELYFGVELSDIERLSYSLPPKPPAGAFDVRFKDGWRAVKNYGEIEVMPTTETLTIAYDIKIDAGENMNWVLTATNGEEYILEGSGEITIPSSERFILNRESVIPVTFALHQNYPNPFNPITTLRYDLPKDSDVRLAIFDMLGNEVNTLVSSNQQSGLKSVKWDATDSGGRPVSAGVYLYQIQAGEFVQTRKMVLLK